MKKSKKIASKFKRYKREIPSSSDWRDCYSDNLYSAGSKLISMPFFYPLSCAPIQNSSKLRALFAYKLPCMYSGVPMIDPKQLSRWMKNKLFKRPAPEVLEVLRPFRDSFVVGSMEEQVLKIVDDRAKVHPNMNLKELLLEVKPIYSKELRKLQIPIFHELLDVTDTLPYDYQHKYRMLIKEAESRLNETPVLIPFSSYEFKYKLCKIKDDISKGQSVKAKKVMNKLIKESKHLSNATNDRTIGNQKKVIKFMEQILRKSVLSNCIPLKELINLSKRKLNKEEIIVPFTRKSFIYDVVRIIEDYPDSDIQDKVISIAQKLPTSKDCLAAYVVKITTEHSDKIGYRLVWPSLASIEHLLPRSCGGADVMANFGGATTRENSARKNIDFVEQLEKRPETPINCQKYVDKLVELSHSGVFDVLNINPKYVTDFVKTIYRLSSHKLKLDASGLYL